MAKYSLDGRFSRVRVVAGAPLVGRSSAGTEPRQEGVSLLAIERQSPLATEITRPASGIVIEAGDVLLVDARASATRIEELRAQHGVETLPVDGGVFSAIPSQEIGMVEALIPPIRR